MSHRHDGEILGGVLAIRMESLFRRGTVWTFRDITVRLVVQLASLSLSLSPSIYLYSSLSLRNYRVC